jgi:hypothetical protein
MQREELAVRYVPLQHVDEKRLEREKQREREAQRKLESQIA